MGRNTDQINKIRKSLLHLAESIESEPIIFIDAVGGHWLNNPAEAFISAKGIVKEDFMNWVKIGSSHLQNFSYGDIDIGMMRLPDEGALVFLRHDRKEKNPEGKSSLTRKETEVLHYLAKGFSNKQIAIEMQISPGTVNSHLDNIYQKLCCSSRSVACVIALKNGLLHPACKTTRDKRN
jgi:DNA-binding CsgD family transcriptional regulator